MSFNVGDIVIQIYQEQAQTELLEVLAIDQPTGLVSVVKILSTKTRVELNRDKLFEYKFKLITPAKTSKEKVIDKIKYLDNKFKERQKLVTSSKQNLVPDVGVEEEISQVTTSPGTLTTTPSATHADTGSVLTLRTVLERQRELMNRRPTSFYFPSTVGLAQVTW